MNTDLLLRIRDWLVADCPGDWDFDMEIFIEAQTTPSGWCGTACCIAGAALLFGDPECLEVTLDNMCSTYQAGTHFWWSDNVETLAAELLGLDEETATRLFLPWSVYFDDPLPPSLPPSLAARVIDNLIETGIVDWKI